jgi:hypothetical protein
MPYSYTLADATPFETALTVISTASTQLGLGAVADPYGSTDPNVIQMRSLLSSIGRKLAAHRRWRTLTLEHTFDTANGTAEYALPNDFVAMVDQSEWNRTTDRQALPVGAEAWQYLATGAVTSTINALFRVRAATVEISPTPTGIATIGFEYLSRYWVQTSGAAQADKDAPTANTDALFFDSELLVSALKRAFLKAKGWDATNAEVEYQEALALAEAADVAAAPRIGIGGQTRGFRRLGYGNIPDGGYGA